MSAKRRHTLESAKDELRHLYGKSPAKAPSRKSHSGYPKARRKIRRNKRATKAKT